ncbi:MAG: ImmA/IrrE family metallo-endopeptidase [Nanoarchaeota archaeon]
MLCAFGESYIIQVKKDDALEEQIKTILHELAHLSLEGKNLDEIDSELNKSLILGRLSLEQKKLIVKIEEDIEKSQEVFMKEICL